jgi:hypothetical protein
VTSLGEVLALDNSSKHKIQRLLIVCSASTARAAQPKHEVQVDFPSLPIPTSKKTPIAISVRSDDASWASRTLSEVEEQVERTLQPYVQPLLLVIGICAFLALAFLFAVPDRRDDSRTMWLHSSDLERVDALVREQRIITEQELRKVVTWQLRNVLKNEQPQQSTVKGGTRQLLFISIPLATVVVCALVLLLTCYPPAVFLWGDEVGRYASMLQRRNFLWSVIIAVPFVGLLSNLFYAGVVPWFSGL